MTDRVVVQDLAEVSSKPTPGSELPEFQGEVLSRASFGARAATFTPETAIAPVPPNLAATWLAESLAHPWRIGRSGWCGPAQLAARHRCLGQ